ncbi:MAG TPA: Spy/CpxP family protein refolding chaperone [Pyrinomonadaceae bacterium]|jgi:protein CpxP|nr:Spy/CpxP family protein refolding chaperone [Pyrinomonadaceae bacterium]
MRLKKMKLAAFALAAVAGMALAATAFPGQEGHHGPGGPHGPHGGSIVEHLSRALDLTDAQKAQVKQIEDSLRESTKSLHEQLAKSGDGGGPLDGFKDGFDEATVRSAAQARAAVHVELEVAHARAMSQIYALLTDAQKAKLAELRQQFQQRRPGPPPPPEDGEQ